MSKAKINYIIDVLLLILSISTFTTGMIKFPGFLAFFGISLRSLPMPLIKTIHDYSGLSIGILVLLHIILHWKWMITMTKQIFGKKKVPHEN